MASSAPAASAALAAHCAIAPATAAMGPTPTRSAAQAMCRAISGASAYTAIGHERPLELGMAADVVFQECRCRTISAVDDVELSQQIRRNASL